jgi:hypothetical protein
MQENVNGRAASTGEQHRRDAARLPVRSLDDARGWLAAPFPGVCIGYLPSKLGANSHWAAVFPYVDVTAIQDRLDLVVAPEGWSHDVTRLDDTTVVVAMRVLGIGHSEVGQGSDSWSQSANAFKRCARHFGIGRYLTQLPPVRLKLGEQIPVNRKGSPYITDQLLGRLRATYEQQVRQLERRFGGILVHPGAGAHAGEVHSDREAEPGARRPDGTGANPHGSRLRQSASARRLEDAQLANVILTAAGAERKPPERAAALLPTLLERVPEEVAQKALQVIADVPARNGAAAVERTTPRPNPHGLMVSSVARIRQVPDVELAQLIITAAGGKQVADAWVLEALPGMLKRIDEPLARKTIELIDERYPAPGREPEGDHAAVSGEDFASFEPARSG